MVSNVNKKKNKDNNRMIRIDERASNGQQAASKWTMGGMGLFTGRTLSTFEHDEILPKRPRTELCHQPSPHHLGRRSLFIVD